AAGGLPVFGDDRLNLIDSQLMGHIAAGLHAGEGRGADGLKAGDGPGGVPAGMMDFQADAAAMGVSDFGQFPEPGDAPVIVDPELMRAASAFGVDKCRLDVNPANSAAGAGGVMR